MACVGSITRLGFGVLASAGVATAMFGISAVNAATSDEIKKNGTLRVGVLVDYPPSPAPTPTSSRPAMTRTSPP